MSEEETIDEGKKKTKKVIKKVIVKRIVKRKKTGDSVSEISSENDKPSEKLSPTDKYVDTMDDMTRKAMEIAKDHLESSFNLNKCNGYLNYLESTA
tara:strand:- start:103 stop:390 length:288 start_codon:yes stop_codon:yes gene_type:complete